MSLGTHRLAAHLWTPGSEFPLSGIVMDVSASLVLPPPIARGVVLRSFDDRSCTARFLSSAAAASDGLLSWREPARGTARGVFVKAAVGDERPGVASTVAALRSRGRFPKKWLGQHCVVNESVTARMVAAAEVSPGDVVLEIGPGTGALTSALVDAGARVVVAVEKDPAMASLVRERFPARVRVVEADFLKWPVAAEMAKLGAAEDGRLAKVVCNLPFNITTEVIKRILPLGDVFSRAVLLLQDEAALRLVSGAPAPDEYRAMTILVNFFAVARYRGKVSRKCFLPAPRVDGGVVAFDLRREAEYPPVGDVRRFLSVVQSAFNGKRKMMRNSLQHLFAPSDVEVALLSAGLAATARPAELTVDDFAAFYRAVSGASPTLCGKQAV